MDVITQVGEFIADCFVKIWSAFGVWGVIGACIITPAIVVRIVKLLQKIFQF